MDDELELCSQAQSPHRWALITVARISNPQHAQIAGVGTDPYVIMQWCCPCGAMRQTVRKSESMTDDDPDKLLPKQPPSMAHPGQN